MASLKTIVVALILAGGTAQAQTGLGPVYQALLAQGFTQMQSYREQNRIRVTAHRGGTLRQLVYDAQTGRLLWDSMDPNRDHGQDHLYMRSQDQLSTEGPDGGMDDHDSGMGDHNGNMGRGSGFGNGGGMGRRMEGN